VIHSAAWVTPHEHGLLAAAGESFARRALPGDALVALVGRPVKYLSRMTAETKACLAAAAIAMRTLPIHHPLAADRAVATADHGVAIQTLPAQLPAGAEIGLLAAGENGCLDADRAYFRDYVESGRSMGRGNLFIYTLPTSTLGELAIALSLTGPSIYAHADRAPIASLVQQAQQMIADGEAGAMLAVWSDAQAAVCLAIARPGQGEPLAIPEGSPADTARWLRSRVRSS
jgi:hypothetical protein